MRHFSFLLIYPHKRQKDAEGDDTRPQALPPLSTTLCITHFIGYEPKIYGGQE